jgi:nitrite reductase/ring-hydroxylating ferredoxin subunit/hemoglobin-like flavoprotein
MNEVSTTQERFKRGAVDAGRYFNYMAEFIGFSDQDAETIKETRFIIEKHIPAIVGDFYAQLLRFPPTRKFFEKRDGSIDHEYLKMRMEHQANFWRRAASADFNDDFARYIDYVGRVHTSQGADPNVYIPERYVIGMVGHVQQKITEALKEELHEIDPDFEIRAVKAWSTFMMVVLELLSRSYGHERQEETFENLCVIDPELVKLMAVDTYERSLGIARSIEYKEVYVGIAEDIPDGERKIIQADDLSIGVFHHQGAWYALMNSCLHRGGPVCEGPLEEDILTCPWHGYQYNLPDGRLLLDPNATLPMYPVELRDGELYLTVPIMKRDYQDVTLEGLDAMAEEAAAQETLNENEFRISEVASGQIIQVDVEGEPVAVYNLNGEFYATQDECTHAYGPLSEGELDGNNVICPWHDSCFDVTTGEVTCGPAEEPLKVYRVIQDGDIGRVEAS